MSLEKKLHEALCDLVKMSQIDEQLETALYYLRMLTNAEAGTIYTVDYNNDSLLRFRYIQNDVKDLNLDFYRINTLPIDVNSVAGRVAFFKKVISVPAKMNSACCGINKKFDLDGQYRTESMLAIPLLAIREDTKKLLGVVQLINARDSTGNFISFSPLFLEKLEPIINLISNALEKVHSLRQMLIRTITMTEYRDSYETGQHINRVANYSTMLYELWAKKHKKSKIEIYLQKDILIMAAYAHDVGKIGVSDSILKKKGPLTAEEYNEVKCHTFTGYRIFHEVHSIYDKSAALVALRHHEWWNGEGYPGHINLETGVPLERKEGETQGLKGEEIPFLARLVCITDVFDALSTRRAYKEAWNRDHILEEFIQKKGIQFDPELIDIFIENQDIFFTESGNGKK